MEIRKRQLELVEFMVAIESAMDSDGVVVCQRCGARADVAGVFEGFAACEPCIKLLQKGTFS